MDSTDRVVVICVLAAALLIGFIWESSCQHEIAMAKLGYQQEYNGRATLWVKKNTVKVEESK